MANALVGVGLLRGHLVASACQAALAHALACVAEGFVERAVEAVGRVCQHACYDESGLSRESIVGGLAPGDGLCQLVVEVFDALASGPRRRYNRLVLCQRHPAESLVGRERPPGVQNPLHSLLVVFRTRRHLNLLSVRARRTVCWSTVSCS